MFHIFCLVFQQKTKFSPSYAITAENRSSTHNILQLDFCTLFIMVIIPHQFSYPSNSFTFLNSISRYRPLKLSSVFYITANVEINSCMCISLPICPNISAFPFSYVQISFQENKLMCYISRPSPSPPTPYDNC